MLKSIRKLSTSDDEEQIFKDFSPTLKKLGNKENDLIYIHDEKERYSSEGKDSGSLEDFKIIRFISKGTYGMVFLGYLEQKNKYFAIKCLQKDKILT